MRRECHAGHASGHRTDAVGGQFRAHQWYAHRAGRQLVLADRQPRTPQPTFAQPQRHEDDENGQDHEDEVPGEVVERAQRLERDALLADRQALHRIDRGDALGAVGDVQPAHVVAVVEDLRDYLAEPERDKSQVVTAQPQRRRADEHAEERADGRAGYDDEPEVDVDAAHDERCGVAQHVDVGLVEEAGHQPAGDVPADRPESDEAEVEQSGVADDDIETECRHDPDQRLVDRDQREPLLYEVVHRRVEVSQREHVVEDERPDRQRRTTAK